MRKLVCYLRDFRKEVILGPLFKLTEAIFELIVPLVMAQIIDTGIRGNHPSYILRMGGVLVLLGVTGLLCALVCQYFAAKASQGVGTVLRNDLFRHINSLSYAEVDKIGTPSLLTRLINDVNQLQLAVAMLIRLVIRAPFLVLGSTVMAMLIDLRLSLIFLAAAPLIAGAIYLIMSRSIPFYKVTQKFLDRVSLITRENLSGARVIRAFSRQEAEQERFQEAASDIERTAVRVGKISALLNPATSVIVNLAIIAIIWFGGLQVDTGRLTQGEITALVSYMTQIMLALIVIANLVVIFTKASACGARVSEVLELAPSVTDAGNTAVFVRADAQTPKVSFEGVSFAYAGAQENALEDIGLCVRQGETIGVIGGTGSGKSTFVNLIPRFYDVTAGRVLIDGVDVKTYPFAELRGQIGVVPQKAVLFAGTLRENMQWRKADATDEEIYRALEIAQAAEFVNKLPEGLDTMLQQGGGNLSGGQRQRLTIARALVGSPQILILDDSASALDFATDAALRKALRSQTKGMTVFMVSQRAGTVRAADRIVVLDDGKIAGIGPHQELFERCAVYQEICLSQMNAEEAAG
ncbi:MAG TPA: ABC transporter ATP-binding protein [Candidatus Fimivicinus intestinavium]|nr:ABC transporter ATP-binding protein [Candidatus Fimivicinus intestinavium]